MLSDDIFTARLQETIAALNAWAGGVRDVAEIEVAEAPRYWRMIVRPHVAGAAPFQVLLTAERTFSLKIDAETYTDKPVDTFDFFDKLVRALEGGHAARIETHNGLTGALAVVETRVDLGDGWAWVGERRIDGRAQRGGAMISRSRQFLPYRR